MSLKMAQRLCPHAVFLRGNHSEYSRLSKIFHAILRDFTPLVESGGLDEAYLDITGCEGIVGTPAQAAAEIRRRVHEETGLAASVGIGSSRMIAKIASDRAKPDGVLDVEQGRKQLSWRRCRCGRCRSGASAEKKLRGPGISTLGQLAAFSDSCSSVSLACVDGPVLAQRARGIDHAAVAEGHDGRKSISREGTFNEDVASGQKLRSVLRAYSESVAGQVREEGLRARTVSLKLRYGDFTTISRSATLKRPANSNDAIYEAVEVALRDREVSRRKGSAAHWRGTEQLRRRRPSAIAGAERR